MLKYLLTKIFCKTILKQIYDAHILNFGFSDRVIRARCSISTNVGRGVVKLPYIVFRIVGSISE